MVSAGGIQGDLAICEFVDYQEVAAGKKCTGSWVAAARFGRSQARGSVSPDAQQSEPGSGVVGPRGGAANPKATGVGASGHGFLLDFHFWGTLRIKRSVPALIEDCRG